MKLLIILDDQPADPGTIRASEFVAAWLTPEGKVNLIGSPDCPPEVLEVLRPANVERLRAAQKGAADV